MHQSVGPQAQQPARSHKLDSTTTNGPRVRGFNDVGQTAIILVVMLGLVTSLIGAVLVNVNPAYRVHELEYVLTQAGVHVRRADHPDDVADMVAASAALAFDSHIPVAVLLSQRLIGAKVFVK